MNTEMKLIKTQKLPPTTLKPFGRRIAARATWDKLALPAPQLGALRRIIAHVRKPRGAGCCVLFAGPAGTGKTRAAQVLARELQLGLYRVDLAAVVSKYIGETEKNLHRLFATAEAVNGILFFDEADALFGKRTEVRDAHDRYANLEISYLLQRLKSHRGLVILAAKRKANLDEAFTRRLRFMVNFAVAGATAKARKARRER